MPRPERRGVRPLAGRQADGDFHDGLLGIRCRRVQARRQWITCSNPSALPTSAARRGKPIRSTNCATTSVRGNPKPLPEALPKDKEYISVKADYKVSLVEIQRHRAPGKRRGVRADAPCRRHDDHHAFPGSNMEAALPSDMFVRVHRSYIVNLRCIKGYVRGRVFLSDTEYVPVGENYKESFQHYIEWNFKNLSGRATRESRQLDVFAVAVLAAVVPQAVGAGSRTAPPAPNCSAQPAPGFARRSGFPALCIRPAPAARHGRRPPPRRPAAAAR